MTSYPFSKSWLQHNRDPSWLVFLQNKFTCLKFNNKLLILLKSRAPDMFEGSGDRITGKRKFSAILSNVTYALPCPYPPTSDKPQEFKSGLLVINAYWSIMYTIQGI